MMSVITSGESELVNANRRDSCDGHRPFHSTATCAVVSSSKSLWTLKGARALRHSTLIVLIVIAAYTAVAALLSSAPGSVRTGATVYASPQSGVARSIWSDSTVPGETATPIDSSAVELGVKFQSSANGYITGVRFYKGVTNTGVHVGNLWTSAGALMATAVFTSETSAGWQEVSFESPVQITANTTYVASYHTNVGHYAFDFSYFGANG